MAGESGSWFARLRRATLSLYGPNRYRIHGDIPSDRNEVRREEDQSQASVQRSTAAHWPTYSLEQATNYAIGFLKSQEDTPSRVLEIRWCKECRGHHLVVKSNGEYFV